MQNWRGIHLYKCTSLLSARYLTTMRYKRMRLITRVYGGIVLHCNCHFNVLQACTEQSFIANKVDPLIKDTPYKGHNRIHLHSKDTLCGPKCLFFLHTYKTFVTSKKWTAFLKRTKNLIPMCPRFHCSQIFRFYQQAKLLIHIFLRIEHHSIITNNIIQNG